jgi:hypothetical protein
VKKKHFIFIVQNNNKNKKHIKINKNKKVKSFYKKLKPGDFTVAEGHEHPLVMIEGECNLYGVSNCLWAIGFLVCR